MTTKGSLRVLISCMTISICYLCTAQTMLLAQPRPKPITRRDLDKIGLKLYNSYSLSLGKNICQFLKGTDSKGPLSTDADDEYSLYYEDSGRYFIIPDISLDDFHTTANQIGFPYEEINVSGDRTWFVAYQKIASHESSGYLFHYNGETFSQFTILGKRFDEAAWNAACHFKHIPETKIDEAHMIKFGTWHKNQVSFRLIGQTSSRHPIEWNGLFNISTRIFKYE